MSDNGKKGNLSGKIGNEEAINAINIKPKAGPREFWIADTDFGKFHYMQSTISKTAECKNENDFKSAIHVIEYFAYKEAIEKCAELESRYASHDEQIFLRDEIIMGHELARKEQAAKIAELEGKVSEWKAEALELDDKFRAMESNLESKIASLEAKLKRLEGVTA